MSVKKRYCAICSQLIEAERIEALPDTRLCAEHGKQIHKYGGEFIVTATQERTSKAGSLKINYGSVSTSKVRNDEALDKLRDEFERGQQTTKE